MPTVIHDEIKLDPERIETGFQPNHGQELTTEAILKCLAELDARPEMSELFELIRRSVSMPEANRMLKIGNIDWFAILRKEAATIEEQRAL